MQSETRLQAVPTAADSWVDMGAVIVVPANVTRLARVEVNLAPDWGTSAVSVRHAPVYRILGSGLQEQSPHSYLGPFGGVSVVTTGGLSEENTKQVYDVDIPVSVGGSITAQVNTLDEAVTAGSTHIALFYDDKPSEAKNSQSDYVDVAGTTTADAWTTVGTFTVPKQKEGSSPAMIKEIVIGVAVDQGTSAISLRTAPRIRLTGSGLDETGLHEYDGPTGTSSHCGASASQGVAMSNLVARYKVDIPVAPGGQILAEHIFDIETPTASTVAVGLMYGA